MISQARIGAQLEIIALLEEVKKKAAPYGTPGELHVIIEDRKAKLADDLLGNALEEYRDQPIEMSGKDVALLELRNLKEWVQAFRAQNTTVEELTGRIEKVIESVRNAP